MEDYRNLILSGLDREVEKLLINEGINPREDKDAFFQTKEATLRILSTFIDTQNPLKYRAIQPLLKIDTDYTEGIDILEGKGIIERHPSNQKLVRLHKNYYHERTGRIQPTCETCDNYPRLTRFS